MFLCSMSFNCIFNSSPKTFNVFTVSSMKLITLIISTFLMTSDIFVEAILSYFDDLRCCCGGHIAVFWWPPMLLWRPSPSFLMNSDVVVEAISSFFDDLRYCCGGHVLVFWWPPMLLRRPSPRFLNVVLGCFTLLDYLIVTIFAVDGIVLKELYSLF